MVMISRKERRDVLTHLFKEGVMVVEKDPSKKAHDELKHIWNLKVYMICRSLKSRGYLKEVFNWQWHYYFISKPSAEDATAQDGLAFLREQLNLPEKVLPATYTKQRATRPTGAPERESKGKGRGKGGKGKGWGGKGGGFGRGRAMDGEAGGDAAPEFKNTE